MVAPLPVPRRAAPTAHSIVAVFGLLPLREGPGADGGVKGVRAGDALGRSELRGGDHLHKSARPLAGIDMRSIVSTEVVGFELERRSV